MPRLVEQDIPYICRTVLFTRCAIIMFLLFERISIISRFRLNLYISLIIIYNNAVSIIDTLVFQYRCHPSHLKNTNIGSSPICDLKIKKDV